MTRTKPMRTALDCMVMRPAEAGAVKWMPWGYDEGSRPAPQLLEAGAAAPRASPPTIGP